MFAKWAQSYRDLPLLINQWANVVRWEMRPRLFLRTAEFLWQEGHTAHATRDEAVEETMRMLEVYRTFAEEYLAMPVIKGEKTAGERFPGAVATYSIEAMMQDRKALQAGTSHFLGQNFSKASGIKFQSMEGREELAWTTSWGVSTRLIGGLVMTHGDDNGLVVPPKVAPVHVVIIPVLHKEETKARVLEYSESLARELADMRYDNLPIRVEIDKREIGGADKQWGWIKKGVPVRVEIGPREVDEAKVFVGRRDRGHRERYSQSRSEFVATAAALLEEIQAGLLETAKKFREQNTRVIDSKEELYAFLHAGERGEAGDTRRVCAGALVRGRSDRGAGEERPQRDDTQHTDGGGGRAGKVHIYGGSVAEEGHLREGVLAGGVRASGSGKKSHPQMTQMDADREGKKG